MRAISGELVVLQPPRPPHWGGYRLHDRLRYRLADTSAGAGTSPSWVRERLAP